MKTKKIMALTLVVTFLSSSNIFAESSFSKAKSSSSSSSSAKEKNSNTQKKKKKNTTKISDIVKLLEFIEDDLDEYVPIFDSPVEDEYNFDNFTSISKKCSASEFELSILAEVNLMRSNPKDYAEKYIKPRINSRSSSYWTSCVNDMSKCGQLSELSYAEGLYRISKDHSSTQGKTGQTGHTRTNGQDWTDCIDNYGTYSNIGENISYGMSTPREILIQLLVDDGVSSLGHRKNLLSTEYTSIGVSFDDHQIYACMCVMNFATNWKDR